jgi:hypothetical protein
MNDGLIFAHGIKGIEGKPIRLPSCAVDYLDKDRLAERFARFAALR